MSFPVKPRPDGLLVAACLAGDRAAWDSLVARFRPLVLRVAATTLARCGAGNSLAEDVAGEVFAELLAKNGRALSRLRAPFSLGGWLTVVARRSAVRVLERSRRDASLEEPASVPSRDRTPVSDLAQVERHAVLRQHLDRLPTRDRLALRLFYVSDHSYREVARVLDVPEEHVGMVLRRARQKLAKSLARGTPHQAGSRSAPNR